jgi:predicted nucleotidyltransferase
MRAIAKRIVNIRLDDARDDEIETSLAVCKLATVQRKTIGDKRKEMEKYIDLLPFGICCKDKLHCMTDMILQTVSGVQKIVLFGSYARFEQTAVSDIDILVLTECEVAREIRGDLCSKFDELNSDLIFYTDEKFRNSDCLLVKQIRKEGVLLWKN